jgi:hypothetical protein
MSLVDASNHPSTLPRPDPVHPRANRNFITEISHARVGATHGSRFAQAPSRSVRVVGATHGSRCFCPTIATSEKNRDPWVAPTEARRITP